MSSVMHSVLEDTIHVTLDHRFPLDEGLGQLRFISHNRQVSSQPRNTAKVFKDYILSAEAYPLQ